MKIDMTIGRQFTFNLGNYSSTKPLLSMTARDVKLEDIQDVHKMLDIIVDGLYHKQFKSDVETMAIVKKFGFEKYFREIDEEQMDAEITNNIRLLINKGE